MKRPALAPVGLWFALLFQAGESPAETITLDTRTDNILVGQADATGGSTAPLAVGDGWFTGSYAGTVRQRSAGNQEQLRTQWYFRFDASAIGAVNPADITAATLRLPQIGRLNANAGIDTVPLRIFDPNESWDGGGTNYPKWNLGREAPNNTGAGAGGTLLESFADAYDTFGTGPTDISDPDVEGVFMSSSAALLATVQSWAASGANNEGFLVSFTGPDNIGLAFGNPTLEITVVPEPSAALMLFAGAGVLLRRRRSRME